MAVVVFQSKGLTGGGKESERGREEGQGERGSVRGEGKRRTGDCSFFLLIRVLTPTGCSSIKEP